jgi:hypothetical protein
MKEIGIRDCNHIREYRRRHIVNVAWREKKIEQIVEPNKDEITKKHGQFASKNAPLAIVKIDLDLFDDKRPLQHLGTNGADIFPDDPDASVLRRRERRKQRSAIVMAGCLPAF